MTTEHPRLAAMLYNRPLAISEDKLTVIESIFREHAAGVRVWPSLAADIKPHERMEKPYRMTSGGTAIVPVFGTLVHRASGLDALSGISSYDTLGRNIAAAAADSGVRGILLEIDSHGGEVDGLFDLADKITTARSRKPIWAIANESSFSAAYAIAAATQRILAPRSAMLGSIGVIALHIDQSKFDAKLGVKYTAIHAGARKNEFSQHQPLSDSARARVQELVDSHYGLFVGHVERARGISAEKVRATEAGIFTVQEAVKLGLADGIAGLEETIAQMEATYTTQSAAKSPSPQTFTHTGSATLNRAEFGEIFFEGMDPDRAAQWARNAWAVTPAAREEFETAEDFAAFARASAKGLTTAHRGKVVTFTRDSK